MLKVLGGWLFCQLWDGLGLRKSANRGFARKKVVDALLEVKRANCIPAETAEATQPVENEKREPALKRYMNE